MIESLAISLILTIIIEVLISVILGIKTKDDIEVVFWANICTNPVVVFIANCVRMLNNILVYNIILLFLELVAVIVEFILFKKFLTFNKKLPLQIALINNIISFSIGVIINKYIF